MCSKEDKGGPCTNNNSGMGWIANDEIPQAALSRKMGSLESIVALRQQKMTSKCNTGKWVTVHL